MALRLNTSVSEAAREISRSMKPWMSTLVTGVLTTAIALALWWGLRSAEDRLLERLILVESRQLESSATLSIQSRGIEMLRMARRWESVADPDETEWAADARRLARRDAIFRAFEWREADLTLRWATPLPAASATGELSPEFDDARRTQLAPAIYDDDFFVSSSFAGPDGRRQILFAAPLIRNGGRVGMLVAVARVRDLADSLARPNLLRGFDVSIRQGQELIYGPTPSERFENWLLFDSATIRVGALQWSLDFWPTHERVDRLRSPWPPLVLVLGLLGAFAAVYSTYRRRS